MEFTFPLCVYEIASMGEPVKGDKLNLQILLLVPIIICDQIR